MLSFLHVCPHDNVHEHLRVLHSVPVEDVHDKALHHNNGDAADVFMVGTLRRDVVAGGDKTIVKEIVISADDGKSHDVAGVVKAFDGSRGVDR